MLADIGPINAEVLALEGDAAEPLTDVITRRLQAVFDGDDGSEMMANRAMPAR